MNAPAQSDLFVPDPPPQSPADTLHCRRTALNFYGYTAESRTKGNDWLYRWADGTELTEAASDGHESVVALAALIEAERADAGGGRERGEI